MAHATEKQNRIAFIDFVKGLLNLNPVERWSPQQARMHPFILGEPLREAYVPLKPGQQPTIKHVDINTKPSTSHAPMDTQPSQTHNSVSGSDMSSKRPYGGLPAAPVRSGQKVYDAAAYSQLQAQQQAINAQAAALRQQQAQAAQQSQNPYALPHETARPMQQQQQQAQPSHHLHHTYTANRSQLPTANPASHHPPLSQAPYYDSRLGGAPSQMVYTSSRQRAGTLDGVPAQLQKVQVDLAHYAGQSVTPVLRRDDQYLAWEQRQHQASSMGGNNHNGPTLNRRPSHRGHPQLDYLHDQVSPSSGFFYKWRRCPPKSYTET